MNKISKDDWLMEVAEVISKRSTCNRKKVWCVISKDWLIVSTWFNWVARWESECTETWCCEESSDGCNTIHAEINAIINAARLWVSIHLAHIYCTLRPCSPCIRALINAWIEKIFYKVQEEKYENWHTIQAEDYMKVVKM